MAPTLSAQFTTFGTPVSCPLRWQELVLRLAAETLENDLLRQVEYDMDEQGSEYDISLCYETHAFQTMTGLSSLTWIAGKNRPILYLQRYSKSSLTSWRRNGSSWYVVPLCRVGARPINNTPAR